MVVMRVFELDRDVAPVAHPGINEHRRGRPRWERDEETGQRTLLADRWHASFCDLSGRPGMPGQVEGRATADDVYWLALAPAEWRAAVQVAAIDMCTIVPSAIRRALPHA